jgi:hypothetical protein
MSTESTAARLLTFSRAVSCRREPMSATPTEIRWRGTFETRAEARAKIVEPGDIALVRRDVPRWLLMSCPSACGEVLAINLDRRAGKAWRIREPGERLSVYPSIWRDVGCEAHFVVSLGEIWLFGEGWGIDSTWDVAPEMLDQVMQALTASYQHFADLGEALDVDAWTVLRACRRLMVEGHVEEDDGRFRLVD